MWPVTTSTTTKARGTELIQESYPTAQAVPNPQINLLLSSQLKPKFRRLEKVSQIINRNHLEIIISKFPKDDVINECCWGDGWCVMMSADYVHHSAVGRMSFFVLVMIAGYNRKQHRGGRPAFGSGAGSNRHSSLEPHFKSDDIREKYFEYWQRQQVRSHEVLKLYSPVKEYFEMIKQFYLNDNPH